MESNHRKAVLWDMDGVLVDTGEFHFQTWQKLFGEMGLPFDRDKFRRTFGMNNLGVLRTLLGDSVDLGTIQEMSDRKEAAFREAMRGNAHPLPGVIDWLERLRALGWRQAVASSAPTANIDALLGELGIKPYFDAIVSGGEMPPKPDPAVFLEAARRLDVLPQDCTVMEDAVAGVEAARRAGMGCVAVTNTNPREALVGADRVVDSLEELPVDYFHN